MLKNAFAVVLTASFIAAPSFASPFFNKHNVAEKLNPVQTIASKEDNKSYVDFSGVWTGKCTHTEEMTFKIYNDENIIVFDDNEFSIGALETKSKTVDSKTFISHEAYLWSADRSMLFVKEASVFRYDNEHVYMFSSSGVMSLINDQLIYKAEDFDCTFSRSTQPQ